MSDSVHLYYHHKTVSCHSLRGIGRQIQMKRRFESTEQDASKRPRIDEPVQNMEMQFPEQYMAMPPPVWMTGPFMLMPPPPADTDTSASSSSSATTSLVSSTRDQVLELIDSQVIPLKTNDLRTFLKRYWTTPVNGWTSCTSRAQMLDLLINDPANEVDRYAYDGAARGGMRCWLRNFLKKEPAREAERKIKQQVANQKKDANYWPTDADMYRTVEYTTMTRRQLIQVQELARYRNRVAQFVLTGETILCRVFSTIYSSDQREWRPNKELVRLAHARVHEHHPWTGRPPMLLLCKLNRPLNPKHPYVGHTIDIQRAIHLPASGTRQLPIISYEAKEPSTDPRIGRFPGQNEDYIGFVQQTQLPLTTQTLVWQESIADGRRKSDRKIHKLEFVVYLSQTPPQVSLQVDLVTSFFRLQLAKFWPNVVCTATGCSAVPRGVLDIFLDYAAWSDDEDAREQHMAFVTTFSDFAFRHV